MTVLFNGSTVTWIALASLAAGAVLGSVITYKAIKFYRKHAA